MFLNKNKLLDEAKSQLSSNEKLVTYVYGQYETKEFGFKTYKYAILLATNKRIVAFSKQSGGYTSESLNIDQISSVKSSKGFMGYKVSLTSLDTKTQVNFTSITDINIENLLNYIRNYSDEAIKECTKLHKDEGTIYDEQLDMIKKKREQSWGNKDLKDLKKDDIQKLLIMIVGIVVLVIFLVNYSSTSSTNSPARSVNVDKESNIPKMCDEYERFANRTPVLNDKRAREVYQSDEFRNIAMSNGFTRGEMVSLCNDRLN